MRKTRSKTPPPELWDERCLLTRCEGYKEFLKGEIESSYTQALRLLKQGSNERILDIGCGRGEIVKECAKVTEGAVGIDYSLAAVKIANNHVGTGNIVRASATHLPFKNRVFDGIVMLGFINHLCEEELEMCLQESKRVLKQDGRVLITTPNSFGIALFHVFNIIYRLLFHHQRLPLRSYYHNDPLRVNLKNYLSLRKILKKCGFEPKIWYDIEVKGVAPSIVYRILFFTGPLYCIAIKGEY